MRNWHVTEVRLPISCGNTAKPEHSWIERHFRVETCWSSSYGRDPISSMMSIYRDSNEEVVTSLNCCITSSLTLCSCSVLRQGNEDTCMDVSFGHSHMYRLERRGDKYSFRDAKSPQYLTLNSERKGNEGSSKDFSLQHSPMHKKDRRGNERSSKDVKLPQH